MARRAIYDDVTGNSSKRMAVFSARGNVSARTTDGTLLGAN